MAKKEKSGRAEKRRERIPALIQAIEDEASHEVRAGIWLTLLLKMTPDEVLGSATAA